MKGKVLDFNIQSSEGIISGDDGQRYSFEASQWKSADVHPAKDIIVDFAAEDGKATGIYIESVATPPANSKNDMPKYIYIGFLAGIVIPFVSLICLIIAYVNKGNGPEWMDEHYRFQIRTFWIGMLYFSVSWILMFVLIGWITIIVALVWYIMRCVKGLKAFANNQAPENVNAWLF